MYTSLLKKPTKKQLGIYGLLFISSTSPSYHTPFLSFHPGYRWMECRGFQPAIQPSSNHSFMPMAICSEFILVVFVKIMMKIFLFIIFFREQRGLILITVITQRKMINVLYIHGHNTSFPYYSFHSLLLL